MTDFVKGFREVVQDLLVPELKAMQVELKHLNETQQETNNRLEGIEKRLGGLEKSFEGMKVELSHLKEAQQETNKKLETLHIEMDKKFEAGQEQIQNVLLGQREILSKLDTDKRLSRVEMLVEEMRKQKVAV